MPRRRQRANSTPRRWPATKRPTAAIVPITLNRPRRTIAPSRAQKASPTQVVEAQFAQPFLVATALVHGRVGIAEVDGLGDPAVLALSDRITGVAQHDRAKGSLAITLTRTDGRSITVEATDPIGSPQKPLTDAQFEAKFRDCAKNAVRPLAGASVDAALAAIARLETLPDARELMAPFAG